MHGSLGAGSGILSSGLQRINGSPIGNSGGQLHIGLWFRTLQIALLAQGIFKQGLEHFWFSQALSKNRNKQIIHL